MQVQEDQCVVASVILYPCILCVALLMYLFILCVSCFTVFVNCLVKQFAMCVGVVVILLLNLREVFSVGEGALWDRPCCVCDPSVHLSIPSIGFVYVFCMSEVISHLRV